MKCIEARRMVTPFVKKELSEKDTEAFLNHIEHCSDCMDELDIYYVVYNALYLMDSGTHHEYDFKKMLSEEVRSAKRTIFRRKAAGILRVISVLLAEVLLVMAVYTGVCMKTGAEGESIFWRIFLFLNEEEQEMQTDTERQVSETIEALETEMEISMTEGAASVETEAQ